MRVVRQTPVARPLDAVPMHLIDGTLVLSATDLTGFLACEHLTELDRAVAEGRIPAAVRDGRYWFRRLDHAWASQ